MVGHLRRNSLLMVSALVGAALPAAGCARVTLRTITHRRIEDCVEVKAGRTRLLVVPAWAGRISLLDFGGGNVLWADPKLDGKVVPPNQEWAPWDGNTTDIVRTDGKRQWKGLWIHPWPKVKALDDGVLIESGVNAEANLRAWRRYRLSRDGRMLAYNFSISSQGEPTAAWTIWERALLPPGGYVIAPVARGGAFPNGWVVRDKATLDPPDRAATAGGFLVVRAGAKKGVGIAARLRAGWCASVRGDHALLVTFPLFKEGKPEPQKGPGIVLAPGREEVRYTQCNGAHVAFWSAPEYVELEPLSNELTLEAGRGRSFTQVWHWLELPTTLNRDDPAAVGEWLDGQAATLEHWISKYPETGLFVIQAR